MKIFQADQDHRYYETQQIDEEGHTNLKKDEA